MAIVPVVVSITAPVVVPVVVVAVVVVIDTQITRRSVRVGIEPGLQGRGSFYRRAGSSTGGDRAGGQDDGRGTGQLCRHVGRW